jgi:hypothetical protein
MRAAMVVARLVYSIGWKRCRGSGKQHNRRSYQSCFLGAHRVLFLFPATLLALLWMSDSKSVLPRYSSEFPLNSRKTLRQKVSTMMNFGN